MASRGPATISAKPILGAGLLGLGTVMLLTKPTFAAVTQGVARIETWGDLRANLPALLLALLHSIADILFSPHAYFAVASKLLVSFWPLGLVAAGAVLLLQYSKEKRGRAGARV